MVGGLAQRMLDRQGYGGALTLTGDLDRALDGADFVLIQIRVGGQEARLRDETIPVACGCIGQETTGAGGLAKALRTVPVVLDIAERARERAAAGAWIVDFTNPVGIVTRALLDAGHRAIGLCNVAIGFQRAIAALDGRASRSGCWWTRWGSTTSPGSGRCTSTGATCSANVLADHMEAAADQAALPAELIRELGAIPSYYLRYFYTEDERLAEMRTEKPRAQEVARDRARAARACTATSRSTEKPALLERRGGAFYSEAATQLVAALASDSGDAQVVDVRNGGTLAGLADDDVVEVPARVGRGRRRAAAAGAAGAGAARARAARGGVRAAGGRGGGERRPRDRGEGDAGAPARGPVAAPSGCWTRARGGVAAMSIVLAVDGGGYKTHLALVRDDGSLLAFARGPHSSPHQIGVDGCLELLERLTRRGARARGPRARRPAGRRRGRT